MIISYESRLILRYLRETPLPFEYIVTDSPTVLLSKVINKQVFVKVHIK